MLIHFGLIEISIEEIGSGWRIFHLDISIPALVDWSGMQHIAWVLSPYLPKEDIEEIADRFGHDRHVCGWSNEDDPDIPF